MSISSQSSSSSTLSSSSNGALKLATGGVGNMMVGGNMMSMVGGAPGVGHLCSSSSSTNSSSNGSGGVVEQCLITAKANVMVYDDSEKVWVPCGQGVNGLSKCQIYQHLLTNTYRVVARKISDQELLINSNLQKGSSSFFITFFWLYLLLLIKYFQIKTTLNLN